MHSAPSQNVPLMEDRPIQTGGVRESLGKSNVWPLESRHINTWKTGDRKLKKKKSSSQRELTEQAHRTAAADRTHSYVRSLTAQANKNKSGQTMIHSAGAWQRKADYHWDKRTCTVTDSRCMRSRGGERGQSASKRSDGPCDPPPADGAKSLPTRNAAENLRV